MKAMSNATDLQLEEEYVYIVIGGGTAGYPLAATLSKSYSVLVLESVVFLRHSRNPQPSAVGVIRTDLNGKSHRALVRPKGEPVHASDSTISRCVMGMRKIDEMLDTNSMDRFKYKDYNGSLRFLFNGPSLPMNYPSNDSAMAAFCRSTVETIYHYDGGCLVRKVVGGDFRVMDIDSLRVVYGSTFTSTPGTNPQATVMMLGR
ncbi:hypothetical protein TIFTF001_031882 [Ficus carica]|uniref:Glucose-methanol-choline oxidoreductase C-terminal domain-containing protein n=1 Tax=Ficus carica TaxID=3494 RepID=A0AA88DVV6_FICCA|nr:hypothetical protein TIFTF001_031882 [Ficus carica]